jgi:hypothetical protein
MSDENGAAAGRDGKPDLVEIETTKFLANFIDRAATALLVVGVIAPFFASSRLDLLPDTSHPASTSGVWVFCAIVLHLVGHATLSRLRSEP